MPDTDSLDHKDSGAHPHGDDDADGYAAVSNDPGVEFNALRYLHTHSHLDRDTDTVGDAFKHAHPHSHGHGLTHGHEHGHGLEYAPHHPESEHDPTTNFTA